MGMTDVLEIGAGELAATLQSPGDGSSSGGSLVLDCRPFLSYSRVHVCDSRNVNWNSMLRRRSKGSAVSLQWLVPDRALLTLLRSGRLATLVVLDEGSRCLAELRAESLGRMLLSALSAELGPGETRVCFLRGGFEGFFSLWPQLCVKSPGLCGNRDPETVWTEETPPLYEQDGPVELLPFLFLGSARDASQWEGLAGRGITAVLNVSSRCPNVFEGRLDYRTLRLEDSLATDLTPTLPHAIRFIDSVRERGGRVLVHCQAGVSRSAAVCLAYLMESRRLPLAEALAFVRQRRAAVAPNLAFMGQLLQLETQGLCH